MPATQLDFLIRSVGELSDGALLAEVQRAAATERCATAELIALLMELDARRLYLGEGCSSLFTYCTQILKLSEHAAYGRIEAARAARRFPVILERLADGDITLTTIGLLAQHLTTVNHLEVLDAARGKSKRDVEHLVARLHPQPDAVTIVRKLPEPRRVAEIPRREAPPEAAAQLGPLALHSPAPADVCRAPDRAEAKPIAPERYKVQFTVGRQTFEQLRRVQDLLRHEIPNGDLAAVFTRALATLFADLAKARCGATDRPRSGEPGRSASRHVPAAVRRSVWQRDGGRCAFTGSQGRCTETGLLEFHHVIPFADGGATSTENLELRCRAHNAYEAEQWFGSG